MSPVYGTPRGNVKCVDALHRANRARDKHKQEQAKELAIANAPNFSWSDPDHVRLLTSQVKRGRRAYTLYVRALAALHDELQDQEVHKR
jgi:hypothetical protein